MDTITITIPKNWLGEQILSPEQLRQALFLGLQQLQQSPSASARLQIQQAFTTAGLSLNNAPATPLKAITPSRRAELAQLFATGGPLSDLIIAERAER